MGKNFLMLYSIHSLQFVNAVPSTFAFHIKAHSRTYYIFMTERTNSVCTYKIVDLHM